MVDCGNPRCIQEHRAFKKELLSWYKKVPLLVGLEQVADVLVGTENMTKILEPYNDLETLEVEDWEPENSCNYCHIKTKSTSDTAQENGNGTDSMGSKYLQLPLSFPPSMTSVPLELDDGQPLDLSATGPKSPRDGNGSDSNAQPKPLVELKVPQIKTNTGKGKKDGQFKKNYTETELVAAVKDIRSGKLGTRRAAVLYGIPRSTLRNKIFKMEAEMQNGGDKNLSIADLLQNTSMCSLYGMYGADLMSADMDEEEWNCKLEQIRRKHNLQAGSNNNDGSDCDSYSSSSSRKALECEKAFLTSQYAHELKLPILPDLVRKLAEQRMNMERGLKDHNLSAAALSLGMPLNMAAMPLRSAPSPASHVELKIPSYKPMRSYTNGTPTANSANESSEPSPAAPTNRIGDTLKDIIAKTIAEKVRSRSQMADNYNLGMYQNGLDLSNHASHRSSSHDTPPRRSRNSRKSEEKAQQPPAVDANGKPLKKTRPKRGQYRKYNSQLLLEAVKAVQRGEMSVHRAGSYFGVPHSTLEYKVKERHLLRQKKKAEEALAKQREQEQQLAQQQQASGAATAPVTAFGSSSRNNNNNNNPSSSPGSTSSWSQSNGSHHMEESDASGGNGGAVYPGGFALNTSASELLKKLQRKVQAKAGICSPAEADHNREYSSDKEMAEDC